MSNIIRQFLDTDGDGTGTINANGNYSVTADDFYIVDAQRQLVIDHLHLFIEDAGAAASDEYGNTGAALTNGIKLLHLDAGGNIIQDLLGGHVVKTNGQWAQFTNSLDRSSWSGTNDFISGEISFSDYGHLGLFLPKGTSLVVRVNDDLSGLVRHTFFAYGSVY